MEVIYTDANGKSYMVWQNNVTDNSIWQKMPASVKAVCVDLSFNAGGNQLAKYKNFIKKTTEKEKAICHLLLTNRRKKDYGILDGNPLSLQHFKDLNSAITPKDIKGLVKKGILKEVRYLFRLVNAQQELSEKEYNEFNKTQKITSDFDKYGAGWYLFYYIDGGDYLNFYHLINYETYIKELDDNEATIYAYSYDAATNTYSGTVNSYLSIN